MLTVILVNYSNMASKKFFYNFISEPDDRLKCYSCFKLAVDPKQEEGCGQLFCSECVQGNESKPCPNCGIANPNYYNDKKSKTINV